MPHTVLALARIPVGESEVYELDIPQIDDVPLSSPVTGTVDMFSVSPNSFVGTFTLNSQLRLECDRCLREFDQPVNLSFRAHFEIEPSDEDDSWPVINGQADVLEPIRQELELAVPMKRICTADCPGISDLPKNKQKE